MEVKLFELRDRGTFIPAIAVLMESDDPSEHYLLRRAGYGVSQRLALLTNLNGGSRAEYDAYAWGSEPWRSAHDYINNHWDELKTGDVLDGEFIRGETTAPKQSERVSA